MQTDPHECLRAVSFVEVLLVHAIFWGWWEEVSGLIRKTTRKRTEEIA